MANGIFKRHINRSIGGNILVFLFLLVFGIFFVFPIFYAVITAFKPLNEIFIFPPRLFVSRPTLDNFIELDLMTASFWVPLSRYIFNSLFEAGAIDGVRNRWQELAYITIPSMAPQLLFSAVMQIAASFGVSTVIEFLAGFPTTQYSADTLVTYIKDIGTIRFEMGYATTIAVFLFALMMLTNFIITTVLKRFSTD